MQKKRNKRDIFRRNLPLCLMAAPAMIMLIMFQYVPIFGIVLAFKDFSYRRGIWGSKWVGLDNFKYIFGSGEIVITFRNTILYHLACTVAVTSVGLLFGILLYFVKSKKLSKFYQGAFTIPYFVSCTVMAYILFIFLRADGGILNAFI